MFVADEVNVEADWFDFNNKTHITCAICKKELKEEPIIKCIECSCLDICTQCFSFGLETQQHRSYHEYRVDRRHIPISSSSDWPPEMELDLLNAVLEFGYGNWSDISKRILSKTRCEIEKHFNEVYLENKDKVADIPAYGCNLITSYQSNPSYKYNPSAISEEPPRFPVGSQQYRYFAGYNAPRGDFEIEYDNSAETILSNINFENIEEDDPDSDLIKELQFVMIQQYNERLKERFRRKRIIKNHGLFLLRKFPITLHKYENSIGKSTLDKLFPLMQLISGEKFDFILEGLDRETELKRYFLRLKAFRENGLTRFYSCKLFENLKASRDEMLKSLHQLKQNPALSLKHLNLDVKPLPIKPVISSRRPAPPLNIVLLPGYEKLTEEEKELCSNARIVPESYFTLKELLISESNRNNGIRLATARQLIKIDVNKTRKLFNFLRDKNLIIQIS